MADNRRPLAECLPAHLTKSTTVWTIDEIRNFWKQNSFGNDDSSQLDTDLVIATDLHSPFPLFFYKNEIFTREQLLKKYTFEAMRKSPEDIFSQIYVYAYPTVQQKAIRNDDNKVVRWEPYIDDKVELRYELADRENPEPVLLEQLLSEAKSNTMTNSAVFNPLWCGATKLYLGKKEWKHFKFLAKFVSAVQTFPALTNGDGGLFQKLMLTEK